MKKHIKIFSIISILLISFLFIKPVKAVSYNTSNIILDYENVDSLLTDKHKDAIQNVIDSITYDKYIIQFFHFLSNTTSSNYMIYVYDVSDYKSIHFYNYGYNNFKSRYERNDGTFNTNTYLDYTQYTFDLDLILTSTRSDTMQASNYGLIASLNSTKYMSTTDYLIYYSSIPFIVDTNNSGYSIARMYSSIDNYNKGIIIDEFEEIPTYFDYLSQNKNYVTINDKCTTPGECLSHELELVLDIPQDNHWYGVHYYTSDGRLDERFSYADGGGYNVYKDLEFYHDTTLYVDFHKIVCPSEDNCGFEPIQLVEYDIDVLYSEPTIRYTLSETDEMYYLAIRYYLPLDYQRNDFFYQYRINNGEWILSNNNNFQILEFELGNNYYIESRILNGYKEVVTYSSFNINVSLLPYIRFEMMEDDQEYQNVKVYVSNVLDKGYTYTWNAGSGAIGPFDLEVSEEEILLLESKFGNTSDLYITIYNQDNNVVGSYSLNIPVKRVPTIYDLDSSQSIFSYLTDYFDGLSSEFKVFGNGLQDIADKYSGTSVEQILVVLLIILCLVTTIKLGGS